MIYEHESRFPAKSVYLSLFRRLTFLADIVIEFTKTYRVSTRSLDIFNSPRFIVRNINTSQ